MILLARAHAVHRRRAGAGVVRRYQAELAAIKTAQAASPTRSARRSSTGAAAASCAGTRSCASSWRATTCRRRRATRHVPCSRTPTTRSPTRQFPFANPPYAARAYSYVTVAQFEALKAAWYYKYQYNRPSPSRVDSSIQALMPTTDLPAYPSEDAVLSGVTAEILRLLFPAAVEEITRKAGEQRDAALQSGKATASDIAAGLALGRAVAAVFVARAGSDGMGAAVGNAAQWQAFADAAAARGEIPWKSLETPPRPPMLPNFGKVLAWMMTPDRRRARAARAAALHLVLADGAGGRGGARHRRPPLARAARHRAQVERRRRHLHAARALERHRDRVRARRAHERGARRANVRAPEHGDARRRGRLLGGEVRLLQPAPQPDGSAHQDLDRAAELSVLYVGPLDVLGGGRGRAVVPVPGRRVELRGDAGRGRHLAALRRHPLPLGHRDRQGARRRGSAATPSPSRARTERTEAIPRSRP